MTVTPLYWVSGRWTSEDWQPASPALCSTFQLDGTAKGGYCLQHETKSNASGLLYALTWKVFHHLGASIHGLSGLTSRGSTFVTVYLTLPHDRPLQEARDIVQREFQA